MCLVRGVRQIDKNPCFRNSWLSLSLPLRVQVLSLLAAAKTGHHSRERLLLQLLLRLPPEPQQPLLQLPMLHLILHLPPHPHRSLQRVLPLPELLMQHRLISHDSRTSSWAA